VRTEEDKGDSHAFVILRNCYQGTKLLPLRPNFSASEFDDIKEQESVGRMNV
jgi:hypothetical protein